MLHDGAGVGGGARALGGNILTASREIDGNPFQVGAGAGLCSSPSLTAAAIRDIEVTAPSATPRGEHTVAPDHGKEFASFAEAEAACGVEFFFALPHHFWQRGTNGNANGSVREYFPRGGGLRGGR